jgi:hypothetical protein
MRWTPWLFGCLAAGLVAGCGGRQHNDTGAAGAVAKKDSSRVQASGQATTDTAFRVKTDTTSAQAGTMSSDTAQAGARTDSSGTAGAKSNQTKSGVTDTKTGKSTLGKGVTKTSPDQGQPVTAKGDTLSPADSSASSNR